MAFYVFMYIECSVFLIQSLIKSFRFNEAILRTLVLKKDSFDDELLQVSSLVKNSSV